MSYGEYIRRQREYERQKFARLSDAERLVAWERRRLWLWTELLRLKRDHPQFIDQIFCCVKCHLVWPATHLWPNYFECRCGVLTILDKWLPDKVERITWKTSKQLEIFVRTGPRLYDLFDYPFEERIRDLG